MRFTTALTALALAAPITAHAAEPTLEFAFEETVMLDADVLVGATSVGTRNIVPITGGTFEGPRIRGTIMGGGWDWQLRRADGCLQIKADYMLRTDDGAVINVVNTGVSCRAKDPKAVVRTHPVFEAPQGKYDWLSQGCFVGTLDPVSLPDGKRAVRIRFYRVI
ncbi:DUF3237 domain-containing protein [Novosphingobium sp. B1]|uniref:DUF3237 domain-containing protein n=1 Tax=Novosphingobium sp. B1 TaxID=1938756 RepID=UPI0009D8AF0B|nr:DUF3237 domain-containing protein [Novosphingobium sp. B1]SMC96092.1 Protein of unknown function [Novosphingobium sp. B1]